MSLPGREDPLAGPVVAAVHHVVEHLQAVVAHADRVGVGKRQAELAADRPVVLDTAFSSPPMYWPGRLHPGQDPPDHQSLSSWLSTQRSHARPMRDRLIRIIAGERLRQDRGHYREGHAHSAAAGL